MAAPKISMKHVAIDKANSQMVIIVSAAVFVTVFCLVAVKAQFSLNRYQSHLTTAKTQAKDQLQKNLKAFDSLAASYKAFDGTTTNIIGGISKETLIISRRER